MVNIFRPFIALKVGIDNLLRSDKPESPTDLIFIVGSLVLFGLQIYATVHKTTVPHFEVMLLALGGYKSIKVGSEYMENKQREATKETKTQGL